MTDRSAMKRLGAPQCQKCGSFADVESYSLMELATQQVVPPGLPDSICRFCGNCHQDFVALRDSLDKFNLQLDQIQDVVGLGSAASRFSSAVRTWTSSNFELTS